MRLNVHCIQYACHQFTGLPKDAWEMLDSLFSKGLDLHLTLKWWLFKNSIFCVKNKYSLALFINSIKSIQKGVNVPLG